MKKTLLWLILAVTVSVVSVPTVVLADANPWPTGSGGGK